jgi:hypothetical protein
MKSYVLIGFIAASILLLVFLSKQQKEGFGFPIIERPVDAVQLANLDRRVVDLENAANDAQDGVNAATGKIMMT